MSSFANPADIYRGTDLWMLNGKLDEQELRRQLRQLRREGHYSFIARTYNGLESDYPGEEFMANLTAIIDEAKKQGMRVALQAGYMPVAVPDLPEKYALQVIRPKPHHEKNERVICTSDGMDFTLDSAQCTLDLFSGEAVKFYIDLAYEKTWKRFADEFGKTIFSVWLDEPRYEPETLPWTHDLPRKFREMWGYDLLEKLPLLYFDRDDYKAVRYHYFVLMQKLMGESYFAQVEAWCHAHQLQFSGHLMSEDYLKTQIANCCANMPYYKYFDIPGIDCLQAQQNWAEEPIPSRDPLLLEHIYFNTPIQCASAANQAGKKHILCEMYGVTASNLTFRAQKHIFDHFAVFGFNHRCAHAIFYSLAGFRKRFYPQHFNDYQPYWPKEHLMTDYIARVGEFLAQGDPVGETLVLHPLETAYGLYRGRLERNVDDNKTVDLYDKRFHRLLMDLLANHCPFELGDLATLDSDGEALPDGRLRLGQMVYHTLVLPEIQVLTTKTAEIIEKFCAAGGKLIVLGELPGRLNGWEDAGLREKMAALPHDAARTSADVVRLLLASGRGYRLESGDDISGVLVQRRVRAGKEYYFILNKDCSAGKHVRFILPGAWEALRWHAETGETEAAPACRQGDDTAVFVELTPGGSVLLSFTPGTPARELPPPAPTARLPIVGKWQLLPQQKNLLALEYCQYRMGDGPFSPEYTVHCADMLLKDRRYEGPLTLRFTFQSACELDQVKLILEEREKCTVFLNGERVDAPVDGFHYAQAFETIPLPRIRKGINQLEIGREYIPRITNVRLADRLQELFRPVRGITLETVCLLGDFVVNALPEYTLSGERRYNRSFLLDKMPPRLETAGETTDCGFPFYVGEMRLKKTIRVSEEILRQETVELSLGSCRACAAEIWVNGVCCGDVAWLPYKVPVKQALRPGENEIEIRLLDTLRNMMGPSHWNTGEYYCCSPAAWICAPEEAELIDGDSNTRTDSFILSGYGIADAALTWPCRL